jgi:hypothetical protein
MIRFTLYLRKSPGRRGQARNKPRRPVLNAANAAAAADSLRARRAPRELSLLFAMPRSTCDWPRRARTPALTRAGAAATTAVG